MSDLYMLFILYYFILSGKSCKNYMNVVVSTYITLGFIFYSK